MAVENASPILRGMEAIAAAAGRRVERESHISTGIITLRPLTYDEVWAEMMSFPSVAQLFSGGKSKLAENANRQAKRAAAAKARKGEEVSDEEVELYLTKEEVMTAITPNLDEGIRNALARSAGYPGNPEFIDLLRRLPGEDIEILLNDFADLMWPEAEGGLDGFFGRFQTWLEAKLKRVAAKMAAKKTSGPRRKKARAA